MIERCHALATYDGLRSHLADATLCLAERYVEGAWLVVSYPEDEATPGSVSALLALAQHEPAVGWAHSSASALVAAIAPGRVLTLTTSAQEASLLSNQLDVDRVIECRGQRAWLRFSGTEVRGFLDRQLGIDLLGGDFGYGRFALTRLGLIDVAIHADRDDVFDILVARSFSVALSRQIALRAQAEGRSIAIDPPTD